VVKKKPVSNPLNPFQGFEQSDSELEDARSYSKYSEGSFGIVFENTDGSLVNDTSKRELKEESCGGIIFSDIEEVSGLSETVSLQMDTNEESTSDSDSEEDRASEIPSTISCESPSCVEALDWDEKESNLEKIIVKSPKQKSFMYIVMQLCMKATLRDWLRNNSERKRQSILSIFSQICVGVEYVHSQNLVHRDLKPSNIYFSSDGVIKIGDFGLVTDGELGQQHGDGPHSPSHGAGGDTQHTDQVGTHTYMSPEQLLQQPYSHKVDIFSLGLIFLELLVPFCTQMERLNVLSDVKKDKFPFSLSAMNEEKRLLSRMLHKRPDLRPEAKEILSQPWLTEIHEDNAGVGRRLATLVSEEKLIGIDILNEEILDN